MNQLQINEKVLSYKFLSTVIYQNLTNLLLSRGAGLQLHHIYSKTGVWFRGISKHVRYIGYVREMGIQDVHFPVEHSCLEQL